MDESLVGKFELLRTRIESDLKSPAVLLVTSASRGDGKSVTAHGVATCFAEAGRRVALVDGQPARNPARASGTTRSGLTLLPLPLDEQRANVSSQLIGRFVYQMREMYEFTIIDGAAFGRNNSPVVLAAAVDAVLLTVRLGRVPCDEDRLMCEMLEQMKAPLIGAIAVSPETINAFTSPRPIGDRLPALDPIERTTLSPTTAAR
jgi:Mrp family chromosome partitioning ATPase